MTSFSITFTAVLFLCGFLTCTNTQESNPNVEEVLNKLSNVINLNGSGTPDLTNSNASITNTIEEAKNLFKQKCEKNGGAGAFENANAAKDSMEQCFKSLVNFTKLQSEMEKNKPTGDLDIVFKNYCRKAPTLKRCVSEFTAAVEPCLEPEEKENKRIIQNITDSLLDFVCYKEGDRIALFISADGPECLESKSNELQHCANTTFGSYMPVSGALPGLDNLPPLVLGEKECADISKLQSCVVRELEKCNDPTPANIVDSIFNFIRKVTPCAKLSGLSNSASTSAFSVILAITSIVLSLSRFV